MLPLTAVPNSYSTAYYTDTAVIGYYGVTSYAGNQGTGNSFFGSGGKTDGVPIVAAGGEYVLHPDQVKDAGGGDLDTGHRVLDEFVLRMRKELVKTLKNLPGPKRD